MDGGHHLRWKQELRDAVTRPEQLLAMLGLGDSQLAKQLADLPDFPLRVPMPYIRRMGHGDPNDPLLRQVLPLGKELLPAPGFDRDPLRESRYNPVPGIVHKYQGRVLLITSPACAVHCRYCFRRHFPYDDNNPGKEQWRQSLHYIARDPSISEVILSGGDPLAANDSHLAWLVRELATLPHVKRLRVHSRFPVVIPSRVDDACLAWLTATRLIPVMVLHINHPREIDDEVAAMVGRLRDAGLTVLNQTVLLRGVNDHSTVLSRLSEDLFQAGVLPYYLHLLDPVAGAAHFEVEQHRALALHGSLRAGLPGYLVPRLVRDLPGAPAKTVIT